MSFETDLELSWTTEKIKQWSNAGNNTSATTIDSAVVSNFERMVIGEFVTQAGQVLDLANDIHYGPAMRRGGFFLRRFGGEPGANSSEDDKTLQMIKDVRLVTHSNTIVAAKTLVNDIPESDTNLSAFNSSQLRRNGFPTLRTSPFTNVEEDAT